MCSGALVETFSEFRAMLLIAYRIVAICLPYEYSRRLEKLG